MRVFKLLANRSNFPGRPCLGNRCFKKGPRWMLSSIYLSLIVVLKSCLFCTLIKGKFLVAFLRILFWNKKRSDTHTFLYRIIESLCFLCYKRDERKEFIRFSFEDPFRTLFEENTMKIVIKWQKSKLNSNSLVTFGSCLFWEALNFGNLLLRM